MRFIVVGEGFPPAKVLETILDDERGTVAAVFTDVDQPGRLGKLASKHDIPVHDARVLKTDDGRQQVEGLKPDWLINANSTVIIKGDILEIPSAGCLNLHPGLLPEYAGLHTHQWAIRNNEPEFGSTIHHMEPSVDAGDIVAQVRFPLSPAETGLSLFHRCINEGVSALKEVLDAILSGRELERTKQDLSKRKIYRHRDALDGSIDWSMPASGVEAFVRAANYEPFKSPTYRPRLDQAGQDEAPIVLAAGPVAASEGDPGTITGWVEDTPVIACGEGTAVSIRKAKWRGKVMSRSDWDSYLQRLPTSQLAGRGE